jgi:hypothetical protein
MFGSKTGLLNDRSISEEEREQGLELRECSQEAGNERDGGAAKLFMMDRSGGPRATAGRRLAM